MGAALAATLAAAGVARAGATAGVRVGYDSNVNRSVDEPRGEGYASALAGWARGAPGEDRLEWTSALSGEVTTFPGLDDLDTVALHAEMGPLWVPKAGWTLSAAPFAQVRMVRDTEQSAVVFGARAELRQQLGAAFYLAESYAYTDNRAREEVYSFREHALGATLGAEWGPRFWAEVSYQFSRGESFRAVEGAAEGGSLGRQLAAQDGPGGSGGSGGRPGGGGFRPYRSSAFREDLVRETVEQHAAGLTLGLEGPGRLSWTAGYWYSVADGDSGTALRHEVVAGVSLAL